MTVINFGIWGIFEHIWGIFENIWTILTYLGPTVGLYFNTNPSIFRYEFHVSEKTLSNLINDTSKESADHGELKNGILEVLDVT